METKLLNQVVYDGKWNNKGKGKNLNKFYHLDNVKYQNYKYIKPNHQIVDVFYPPQRESNFKSYKSSSQLETLDIGRIQNNSNFKNKSKYKLVNNP